MASRFSVTDFVVEGMERRQEEERALRPADAWPARDRAPERKQKRVAKVTADFWEFDRVYWPPETYAQGYSPPCAFHHDIARLAQEPGAHVILGPRDHGKTVTAKKVMVWLLVTGRVRIAGTYSSTLPVAQNILVDILDLIRDNPRIVDDFGITFRTANEERFAMRSTEWRHTCRVEAYSEGKSVRGYARGFNRPEFFVADDVETRQSPRSAEQSRERVRRLSEVLKSLTQTGTLLVLGNDFDEETAMHRLKLEQEQGILPAPWSVHVYPAWLDGDNEAPKPGRRKRGRSRRGRPLWPDRFPARSEVELRAIIKPLNNGEWAGDFMQNPRPADGDQFGRTLHEYIELPPDARGVVFVDPNLSLKSKGDRTAMTALLYSRDTGKFYLYRYRVRSYAHAMKLLDDVLTMRDDRIFAVGFDGNVTQESTWTNFVRSWCSEHDAPFPRIEYKRYHVDLLGKNCVAAWEEGQILVPVGMGLTKEGKLYLDQLFAFRGKKANGKDDAPDSLISAYELLHERKYVRRKRTTSRTEHTVSITDNYSM